VSRNLRVLLFEVPGNPYYNVAFDEALLHVAVDSPEPILRIWRNSVSVVVGLFSNIDYEVNIPYVEANSIPVVRRFTGGGAVFHDLGNVNYTLVINKGLHDSDPLVGVDYLYKKLLKGLVDCLKILGARDVEVRNLTDVVVKGFKVSGNSGTIKGNVYLIHGTLLLSADLNKLYKSLIIPPKAIRLKGKVDPVKYRVRNLTEILGKDIGYSEVVKSLIESFSKLLSKEPYFDLPTRDELRVSYLFYKHKYSVKEWNYGLSISKFHKNLTRLLTNVIDEHVDIVYTAEISRNS